MSSWVHQRMPLSLLYCPTPTNVLVLNTMYRDQAVITNSSGLETDLRFRFKYGENTEVYQSCSIMWHGELYVFGGDDNKRQISKVHSCGLYHYGTLRFPFNNGACANFNDERVYLCFSFFSQGSNQCHFAHQVATSVKSSQAIMTIEPLVLRLTTVRSF